MNDQDFLQKAIEEIQSQTFGVTEQFLAIHEVDYTDSGRVRIDTELDDGTVIVYFPVKREKFSFAVYLDRVPDLAVRWVDTVPYASVYFRASSEALDLHELGEIPINRPNCG